MHSKSLPVLASLLALSVSPAAVLAQDSQPPRQIVVTGEGSAESAPDMATLTLGVVNEAEDAGAAMGMTSDAVEKILARLTEMGVEGRDVQTQNLMVNPVWSNTQSSEMRNQITGFVATNTVTVRVRDLPRLGEVLDAVLTDGANEFNGLSFSIQEPEPLVKQARRAAVEDGIEKAQELAEAAGVTLGAVRSLSENGGGGGGPIMMEMSPARMKSVPIAEGEVSVNVSVSMSFDIAE